jgi:uncharacterized protein (TIGR01777 family)|tara:strand:+ start:760 stop:1680 length:921 start_codon:yes stop_codon:yes gene_type:complete
MKGLFKMPTILITGGSGFIGVHFCREAENLGWSIIVLSRNVEAAKKVLPNSIDVIATLEQIPGDRRVDTVINLAGEPLANNRWTESRKQRFCASRRDLTNALFDFFSQRQSPPDALISGSAIGYYGPGTDAVDESDGGKDGFSHRLCDEWESSALQFEKLGTRVCLVRTGIVLGEKGALAKMLTPFKLGLGGPIGDGKQFMSWIHINDMVELLKYCVLTSNLTGPVNATAPYPVTNREFTQTLGAVLHRPAVLTMPAFMVKLLFGEMGVELLLQGQRVLPTKVLAQGFEFRFPQLKSALRDLINKS